MKKILKRILGNILWSKIRAIYLVLRSENELFHSDIVITTAYPGFLSDSKFEESYKHTQNITGYPQDIRWRAHTFCSIAKHCLSVPGDFVMCGAWHGVMAHAFIHYSSFNTLNRKFYLFDTWSGFDTQSLGDDEKHLAGGGLKDAVFDQVQASFAPYGNVELVRGAVPDTLERVAWDKVAFVQIDMNCRAPEIAAMEFFWDKLSSGGAFVLDDYGHPRFDNQRRAHDEFARKKGVSVFSLPEGTGLIFKP